MQNENLQQVLRQVAKATRSRVIGTSLSDANVFAKCPPGLSVEGQRDACVLRHSVKFRLNKYSVELSAAQDIIALVLNSGLGEHAVISFNAPDKVSVTRKLPPGATSNRLPIFTSSGQLSERQTEIITSDPMSKMLSSLALCSSDSLHLYRNAIAFYCTWRDATIILDDCHAIATFCDSFGDSWKGSDEVVKLPVGFRHLEPLAEKWAVSDDSEREEALHQATAKELNQLIEKVGPLISKVNAYLDSTKTEEAARLAALAQAYSEAQLL